MSESGFITRDFVRVLANRVTGSGKVERVRVATLVFGDRVEVLGKVGQYTEIFAPELWQEELKARAEGTAHGAHEPWRWWVKGDLELGTTGVLRMTMVDVQQGDGLVIETPGGKVVTVDGGDSQLFARHLAARFRHRFGALDTSLPEPAKVFSAEHPLPIAAMILTHGDADHFDGLNVLRRSETEPQRRARKRVFARPARVLHNGLVKGPGSQGETGMLGGGVEHDGTVYTTRLVDDPRTVSAAARNQPFDRWAASLDHWEQSAPIDVRRVHAGSDTADLFDFFEEEGIAVELHGPIQEEIPADGGDIRPALRFFGQPKKAAELHLELGGHDETAPSASHTINGHSIAMRLTYGAVRFALTGDMNHASMARLKAHAETAGLDLEAEIVKAPHHGSADFDFATLKTMAPVVALVSSGDEASKEYIHPRATLMAALGKVMRGDTGVLFCTELAAFFGREGGAHTRDDLKEWAEKLRMRSTLPEDADADEPVFHWGGQARDDDVITRKELVAAFSGDPTAAKSWGAKGPAWFDAFERTNFGLAHIRTDGTRVLVFTHSGREHLNEAYRFEVTVQPDGSRKVVFADEVDTQ